MTRSWPEHEKLQKVRHKTQTIGEFLDWMIHSGGYQICQYEQDKSGLYMRETYIPVFKTIEEWLAEWQGIDTKRLDKEKREMLNLIRAQQAVIDLEKLDPDRVSP